MIDEGPGIGDTRIPASRAARTKRCPGSETAGVPASLIRAIFPPLFRRSSMVWLFRFSLKRCRLISSEVMSQRWRSTLLLRVSSQAIRSTLRRMSIARTVMSPRLPIGVETTKRTPSWSFVDKLATVSAILIFQIFHPWDHCKDKNCGMRPRRSSAVL